jgi:hypothetical protein
MELSLADFVLVVISGSFVLVMSLALTSRILHVRAEARSAARRVICRLCLHAFEDHGHGKIVNCPHCSAANERGRDRRLG